MSLQTVLSLWGIHVPVPPSYLQFIIPLPKSKWLTEKKISQPSVPDVLFNSLSSPKQKKIFHYSFILCKNAS